MATDVVVAGAGPVGLLLAAELRLHGAWTIVLDRLVEPTGYSKAAGLHARSVESMELRGLVETLTERGRKRFEQAFAAFPELLARMRERAGLPVPGHFAGIQKLRLDELDTNHPGLLGISQEEIENVLGEHAAELGVELRRGHELVGLTQDADGVTIEVRGPDGDYRLGAGYLVGCDGGRSTVRRLGGFAFEGSEPTYTSRLADVEVPELFADPGMGHHRTPTGYLLVTPFRVLTGEWQLPAERDAPVTVEELNDSISRVLGRRVELPAEPTWCSRFTDVSRLARPYRLGRVLLAGDAAHVHSPAGGQGLNLGLQDALNLGWKLAGAVAGWAPADLLDSYGAERRPVAERVLANTRAQTALSNPDPAITPLRELFAELLELPQVNRYLGEMISGVDIRYDLGADHPLVGSFLPDLAVSTVDGVATARSLLRDGRAVLLDLADDEPLRAEVAGWRDRLDVVTASADTPLRAVFVRPDGYLAWVATDGGEPVGVALARWLGSRKPSDRRPGGAPRATGSAAADQETRASISASSSVRSSSVQ